jgi:hypothetical protein
MSRKDWCIHYNGLSGRAGEPEGDDRCCRAGVKYVSVHVEDKSKGFGQWPCFIAGESLPCEKRHFRTPDEIVEMEREHEEHMVKFGKVATAVSTDAKAHGFKKGAGGYGSVKCPVCPDGVVKYSVASYNGHTHAACSTKGCISWMQ